LVNQSNQLVNRSKPITHVILNLNLNSNRSNRPVNRSNRPIYRYQPVELSFWNSNLNSTDTDRFSAKPDRIPVADPAVCPVQSVNETLIAALASGWPRRPRHAGYRRPQVTPYGHDARAAATPCGRARCPDVLARRGRESRGDRHGACAAQIHAAAAVSSFGKGRGRRQPAGSGPGRSARVVGGAPHPGRRSRAAPRPLDLRARAAPVCRRRAVGAAPRPHLAPAEDALPRLEPWPNKPLVAPLRWLLAVPCHRTKSAPTPEILACQPTHLLLN